MFLTLDSNNSKLGKMSATYVPIQKTCPTSCPLMDNGCYAKTSYVGIHNARLLKLTTHLSAYDIIRQEAREIAAAGPTAKGRLLRLHVSGDARTEASATLLANAARKWDGRVYSYTHAWRTVKRESWGAISILASCESLAQVKEAHARGYAASLVVDKHEGDRAYQVDGVKVIPCPNQTRDVKCSECGLCMNDKVLHDQLAVVAFAVHGVGKRKALKVIG